MRPASARLAWPGGATVVVAILVASIALGGCSGTDGPSSTGPAASPFASPPTQPTASTPTGATTGGDPRTSGYWEAWSTCGPDSQAATAAANGGRAAGWILADDLLADPGIEVGPVGVADCAQGLALLQRRTQGGADRASDPAYELAAQLYTSLLNVAAGARACADLEGAVIAAQALLTGLGFDGTGAYVAPVGDPATLARASEVAAILARYNAGGLC